MSDACGNGVVDDALATWVHGTTEMGPRVEQSHAQPGGEEESRCGNSAAIGRGFVESVYGTSGGGEIRVGVPARSGVNLKAPENEPSHGNRYFRRNRPA